MVAAGNTTEYFYCREQLTGGRLMNGSTRAAGGIHAAGGSGFWR